MIFNKENILKTLNKYNFDSQNYIVISGAALVLQNVKEYTSDIDITVSNELYNQLLKKYSCTFEKEIENYNVWFIDNIINFSNHYYEKIEYIELFGYKVQTIKSVLKLKILCSSSVMFVLSYDVTFIILLHNRRNKS